jgi:hypothetical protein
MLNGVARLKMDEHLKERKKKGCAGAEAEHDGRRVSVERWQRAFFGRRHGLTAMSAEGAESSFCENSSASSVSPACSAVRDFGG